MNKNRLVTKKHPADGSTLLEMLLSSAMLGTVALSIGTVFGVANQHLVRTARAGWIQSNADHAIEHIRRHLVVARAVADGRDTGLFADGTFSNVPTGYPLNPQPTDAINFYGDPDGSGPAPERWQRYEVDNSGQLIYYSDWVGDPAAGELICGNVNPTPFWRPLRSEMAVDLNVSSVWTSEMSTHVNLRGIPTNGPA